MKLAPIRVEDIAIAVAALAGIYLIYKTVGAAQDAAKYTSTKLDNLSNFVADIPKTVKNAIGDSYAEFSTLTGQVKVYGPSALSGTMTRQQALDYADYLARVERDNDFKYSQNYQGAAI